ncbi:MAG: dienelactone hydrolase family protein [Flavobacteriaceae bacterium]|nr:dienelactone hydrolase family protein [Flavobacteriaceae bacterium]
MKIKKLLFLLMSISMISNMTIAQDQGSYQKELFISKGDTLPYRILYPKEFNTDKTYPLLIFLHGSGERGKDNEAQLVHGSYLFLKEKVQHDFPSIVVFPQCPSNLSWNNATTNMSFEGRVFNFPETIEENNTLNLLEELLNNLEENLPVDPKRIYLGGLSMGGMGTFEMLHRNPNRFAAAFAICGGANPKIAGNINHIPLWIFHGEKDDVVPPKYSQQMHDALVNLKGKSKLTLYPEADHDSWTKTFKEPELLPWLFSHSLQP